jgi:cell division protein FtsI/penicillin-binding protein 2
VWRARSPGSSTSPRRRCSRTLARRDTGFVYLARRLPATKSREIRKLDIPGIAFTPANRRVYPRDFLASQLLGTIGTDGKGLSGLEYAEDDVLRGSDGRRRIVRDALGEPISVATPSPPAPAPA